MPLRMGLCIIALVLPQSNALPVERLEHVPRTLGIRQTSTSNEASPKIIVPVVIGVIVAIMIVAFGWWKRRKRTREVINQVRNASNTAANTTAARTNTTNASTQAPTAAPGTGADAPARPPRRRRRRRPSQISTKSLPAYNEQAGDEEIVLVRRNERDSMSDDDYEDESNINHRSANATSTTADAVPLLDDSSPDMPRVSLASSTHGQSPTDHSRTSTSPTTTNDPNVTTGVASVVEPEAPETNAPQDIPPSPHPDDVPAYDEAVASTPNLAASTSSTVPEQTQTPEASTSSHIRQSTGGSGPPADGDAHNTIRPKRKSVFRQFFALNRQGSTSEAPSESVELGANPRPSMTLSVASARTQSNHRPSASVSTIASGGTSGRGHALSPSLSSLILTRSRSPTRSTDSLAQRLNISAPISTTLVRTEISYPRAGPTPEQIRFLSSRESLGRFGMPYGEEAIAAARSRENLSTLPPQYETGETQGTDTGNTQPARGPMFYTPGELALRTETSAAPPERTQTESGQIQLEAEQAKPSTEQTLSESAQTQSESAQIQSEPERIEPGPEPTAVEQHPDESNASASSQSAHLRRFSIASTTAPDANRRESVYTTHSFVTATEGEDTAESDNYSDAESSPPTPTASTYREFGVRPRGQTVLVPESDRALHPELILLPATPTSTLSSRRASPT